MGTSKRTRKLIQAYAHTHFSGEARLGGNIHSSTNSNACADVYSHASAHTGTNMHASDARTTALEHRSVFMIEVRATHM